MQNISYNYSWLVHRAFKVDLVYCLICMYDIKSLLHQEHVDGSIICYIHPGNKPTSSYSLIISFMTGIQTMALYCSYTISHLAIYQFRRSICKIKNIYDTRTHAHTCTLISGIDIVLSYCVNDIFPGRNGVAFIFSKNIYLNI